jgi:hypothetical protein
MNEAVVCSSLNSSPQFMQNDSLKLCNHCNHQVRRPISAHKVQEKYLQILQVTNTISQRLDRLGLGAPPEETFPSMYKTYQSKQGNNAKY